MTITEFKPGDRIEMHPATDMWMRGARYATVTSIGHKLLRVHLDATNRIVYVSPRNVGRIL